MEAIALLGVCLDQGLQRVVCPAALGLILAANEADFVVVDLQTRSGHCTELSGSANSVVERHGHNILPWSRCAFTDQKRTVFYTELCACQLVNQLMMLVESEKRYDKRIVLSSSTLKNTSAFSREIWPWNLKLNGVSNANHNTAITPTNRRWQARGPMLQATAPCSRHLRRSYLRQ